METKLAENTGLPHSGWKNLGSGLFTLALTLT